MEAIPTLEARISLAHTIHQFRWLRVKRARLMATTRNKASFASLNWIRVLSSDIISLVMSVNLVSVIAFVFLRGMINGSALNSPVW